MRFKIEDSGQSFDEEQLNLLTRDTIVQQEDYKNMVIQKKLYKYIYHRFMFFIIVIIFIIIFYYNYLYFPPPVPQ